MEISHVGIGWPSLWFDLNALVETYVFPVSGIALTAIPKNACTAMKSSLLYAEGVVSADSPTDLIHRTALDYRVRTKVSLNSSHRVIALRDPLERVRSAYLDKIVGGSSDFARRVIELVWNDVRGITIVPDDASITFREFSNYLHFTLNPYLDVHFRPQSDFHFLDYDIVIDLEVPGAIEAAFSRLGLEFLHRTDGRTSGFGPVNCAKGEGIHVPGEEWRRLQVEQGVAPGLYQLADDFALERLRTRYADDLQLRHELGLT